MRVGTPAYMSPEQAGGRAGRSTAGPTSTVSAACSTRCSPASRRSPAPTAQAIIARRLTETPRPLRAGCGRDVPEAVEQAVGTALARSPADRFATAAEFAQALRAGATAARRRRGRGRRGADRPVDRARRRRRAAPAAAVASLLGLLHRPRRALRLARSRARRGGRAGSGRSSLAVLPFENLGDRTTPISPTASPTRCAASSRRCRARRSSRASSSAQYKQTDQAAAADRARAGRRLPADGTVRWDKSADGRAGCG